MPQPWAQLKDLAGGSKLYLPVQVVTVSQTQMVISILTVNQTTGQLSAVPSGTFTVNLQTGSVTGQWAIDPGSQPAWVLAQPLTVGDLLKDMDGAICMVQATGLGTDGSMWSRFSDGRSPQTQDGFAKVGHVQL